MKKAVAFLLLATSLAACSPTQPAATNAPPQNAVKGDQKSLFGAEVTTWTKSDQTSGKLTEVGFTLPFAAVEKAPESGAPTSLQLTFPSNVTSTTFIDHLSLDYSPSGHEPAGIYDLPHFDMHFYAMSPEEVKAIDCNNLLTPETDRVPANYLFFPPPTGECVPQMGYHASDMTSPELNQEKPAKFTKTMILGYYGGQMTFVEPMMTREFLMTKQSFKMPIAKPAVVDKKGLFPTSLNVVFDASAQAYQFSLTDFVTVN